MHQNGCVHRDLKPENMLLTEESQVKICDFGWSAEVQAEKALRTTCGTPHYWAPEIFEGLPQGFPVDFWALGTLVYEILVGHAPFWGSMEELRQKVLAVDLRYPPGLLSTEAINLFYCLMQRDPRNRVPTPRLLREHPWVRGALRKLASDQPGLPPADAKFDEWYAIPDAVAMASVRQGGSVVVGSGAAGKADGAATSTVAAGVAAANAASIASAVVAASRESRAASAQSVPVPVPVWSVTPGPSGPAATAAAQAGQNTATIAAAVNAATLPAPSPPSAVEEPVVAPAVRPAAAGRGNMTALSAAIQPTTTASSASSGPALIVSPETSAVGADSTASNGTRARSPSVKRSLQAVAPSPTTPREKPQEITVKPQTTQARR